MEQDIRWKQRFQNFGNALKQLQKGIEYYDSNPIDLVKDGIVQRFEFTHELAWKVMKDFLEYEGIMGLMGSRSATREAFNKGLLTDGQVWMDMIVSRNNTVHTYNPEILETEFNNIVTQYAPLLATFQAKMKNYL